MADAAASPNQIYAKDDEGAKGVIQYKATATEQASVDIRGFSQAKLKAFFADNITPSEIPSIKKSKRRFLLGDIHKPLPSIIQVLTPFETYTMTEAFAPKKNIKLGPPLKQYKTRTNLKVSEELVPELTNLHGDDEKEVKRVQAYFKELQHEGEFVQDIQTFESKYLGWVTADESNYKSKDEQRIVRSAMKLLFQFIFSGASMNDANSYYQHITVGYSKLKPYQKLPCNTDLRADFVKTLQYRRETLSQEILQVAKGTSLIDTFESEIGLKIREGAYQNIFLQNSLSTLDALNEFLKFVTKDSEDWCLVYGDVAPMKVIVSEEAIKQGLSQGVTDTQAELLLRLFRNFVQTSADDRKDTYAYPRLLDMMKNFSKIPDDGERAEGQEIYQELIEHLEMMIGSNAQAYLDDMERHIVLLQELLKFTAGVIKEQGGLEPPLTQATVSKVIEELEEKFPSNPSIQDIVDTLKGIQGRTQEENKAELKKVTENCQKTIEELTGQLAALQTELTTAKQLGEQTGNLQARLDSVTKAKEGLDVLIQVIRSELGLVTNDAIVPAIQELKALQVKQEEEKKRLEVQQKVALEAKDIAYHEQKKKLEEDLAAAMASAAVKQGDVTRLESELATLQGTAARIEQERREATEKAITLQGELDGEKGRAAGLEGELDTLKAATPVAKQQAAEAVGELASARAEAEAARARVATITEEIETLAKGYANAIAETRQVYQTKIDAQEQQHAAEIAALKKEHEATLARATATAEEKASQVEALQKQLDEKLAIVPALSASQEEKQQLLSQRSALEEELTRTKSALQQRNKNIIELVKDNDEALVAATKQHQDAIAALQAKLKAAEAEDEATQKILDTQSARLAALTASIQQRPSTDLLQTTVDALREKTARIEKLERELQVAKAEEAVTKQAIDEQAARIAALTTSIQQRPTAVGVPAIPQANVNVLRDKAARIEQLEEELKVAKAAEKETQKAIEEQAARIAALTATIQQRPSQKVLEEILTQKNATIAELTKAAKDATVSLEDVTSRLGSAQKELADLRAKAAVPSTAVVPSVRVAAAPRKAAVDGWVRDVNETVLPTDAEGSRLPGAMAPEVPALSMRFPSGSRPSPLTRKQPESQSPEGSFAQSNPMLRQPVAAGVTTPSGTDMLRLMGLNYVRGQGSAKPLPSATQTGAMTQMRGIGGPGTSGDLYSGAAARGVTPPYRKPWQGGGGNQGTSKQDICESLLAALLFKADQIAETEDPEFDMQTLVDNAGATLDDLGQCPLVLDLLMRLLDETPSKISPLRKLKQGLTFHRTNIDEDTQAQLDMLEDAYHKRFSPVQQVILTRLAPPVTLYTKTPAEYEELLGTKPFVLEENDMEVDEDVIPLHGLDDDVVLTEAEQYVLENTGRGGISLGALMFLYTLCLKDVLSREEHPTLNSKCRLLNPQRTVERAKTPKVVKARTPKISRRKTKSSV